MLIILDLNLKNTKEKMTLIIEDRIHKLEVTIMDISEELRHTNLVRLPEMEERINKLIGNILDKKKDKKND